MKIRAVGVLIIKPGFASIDTVYPIKLFNSSHGILFAVLLPSPVCGTKPLFKVLLRHVDYCVLGRRRVSSSSGGTATCNSITYASMYF